MSLMALFPHLSKETLWGFSLATTRGTAGEFVRGCEESR